MTIEECKIIELPRISDPRGNLTFIEGNRNIPFAMKRAYWIYDVPGGEIRGGHSYRMLHELIIAVSGSFDVAVDDGRNKKMFSLNRSYYGLYVPSMIWRDVENFSTNSLCLILASDVYSEADYIRDYGEYLTMKGKE
jgi:dTDP-4-dehydrorhamnose 3,5-epimerase-like enzyme